MQVDLDRNPPGKIRYRPPHAGVYSRVVYVEFEIKNFTLSRKQVPLPRDFQSAVNAQLRDQITSRLTALIAQLGAVKVSVGTGDDAREELIDDVWLRWTTSSPAYMKQWVRKPNETSLREKLQHRANEVFDEMINFAPPTVRLVEKNVSPKNVEDFSFLIRYVASWRSGGYRGKSLSRSLRLEARRRSSRIFLTHHNSGSP